MGGFGTHSCLLLLIDTKVLRHRCFVLRSWKLIILVIILIWVSKWWLLRKTKMIWLRFQTWLEMSQISIHLTLRTHKHLIIITLPHHLSLNLSFSKFYSILIFISIWTWHIHLCLLQLIILLLHILNAIMLIQLLRIIHIRLLIILLILAAL